MLGFRVCTVINDSWSWTGKEAAELHLLCGSSPENELNWEGTVVLCEHQLCWHHWKLYWSQGSRTSLNHLSAANPGCEPVDSVLHHWHLPHSSLEVFALFLGVVKQSLQSWNCESEDATRHQVEQSVTHFCFCDEIKRFPQGLRAIVFLEAPVFNIMK